jgi:dihydrofolate reductase
MGKIVVIEFMTLDGVIQAPGGEGEDPEGGFEHGGWIMPYFNEQMGEVADRQMASADAFLLGRKTYDIFASYWPESDEELADVMNSMRKFVVSRTMDEATWQNTTLIQDDVATEIRLLKEHPGKNIHVIGSSELAQTLIEEDLVDEYQLMVAPIVVGSGKRLFRDGNPMQKMELVDSQTFSSGVTFFTYRPKRQEV